MKTNTRELRFPSKDIMTENIEIYLVGGAVRDLYRGVKSNDWDFAVVASSFSAMRDWLIEKEFEIFLETPRYFTIRARAPKEAFRFGGMDLKGATFDFTLCRKDATYTDGRHPDLVEVGTIYDDLARRDFTMNAMAIDWQGNLLDPHNGYEDIRNELIKCVGGIERLHEDGLRILRAIRFSVQTGFALSFPIVSFLYFGKPEDYLRTISLDRIRDELGKMFKIDPVGSIDLLSQIEKVTEHIFWEREVWLEPTTKNK